DGTHEARLQVEVELGGFKAEAGGDLRNVVVVVRTAGSVVAVLAEEADVRGGGQEAEFERVVGVSFDDAAAEVSFELAVAGAEVQAGDERVVGAAVVLESDTEAGVQVAVAFDVVAARDEVVVIRIVRLLGGVCDFTVNADLVEEAGEVDGAEQFCTHVDAEGRYRSFVAADCTDLTGRVAVEV